MSTQTTGALAPFNGASAGSLLMDPSSMERLERLADIMASGRTTVPQHLRGSKGDCFAICLQSMQWGINPFAAAQKTHLVNGVLGYEAQLVAAVINCSGVVSDRFNFEWFGDWHKIVGRFKEVTSRVKKDDNGEPKKYIVPAWDQSDEVGLGVRVWATLKGESKPRSLELLMTQARTRNSTLWAEDPKQQLAYLSEKRWARLYAPDVILGVYTADELSAPTSIFMGQADVITGEDVGAAPAAAPAPAIAFYDQTVFDEKFAQWSDILSSGRKSADGLIIHIEARGGPLTEAQKDRLRAIKPAATVTDVEPKEAPRPKAEAPFEIDAGALETSMLAAKSVDALNNIASTLDGIADAAARARLSDIYDQRLQELGE